MPLAPFLILDALLLLTAALIGWHSPAPLGLYPLLAITACVLGGSALATLPFLTRYARRHDEAQTERDNALALLVEKQAAAAEQLSIATATLHALHTAAVASPARDLVSLSLDRTAASPAHSSPATDAQPRDTTHDSSVVPAPVANSLVGTTPPVSDMDPARTAASDTTNLATLAGQLALLQQQLTTLTARLAANDRPPSAYPATPFSPAPGDPAPATAAHPRPRPAKEQPQSRSPATARPRSSAAPAASVETPTTPTTSASSADPAPFDPTLTPLTLPAEPSAEDIPVDPLPDAEPPAPPPLDDGPELLLIPSAAESTPSTRPSFDGSTQLLVIAYPGQGQTLHLRGDGPGLNWTTGVPLLAHRPGHWSWRTTTAIAPFRVRLFKNDLTPCAALADFTLSPGQETTVHAGF